MSTVGRSLQILGLVILPVGVVMELAGALGRHGVADLLLLLIFGTCLFYTGRYVEGYARR